jgi:hypothetical protein
VLNPIVTDSRGVSSKGLPGEVLPPVPQADLSLLYLKTVISIDDGAGLVQTTRSEHASRQTLHVITAWNPGSARPTPKENEAADEQLRQLLVESGLVPQRAVGRDPDSEHYEEGWAVTGLDDEEARAIGASFGQIAVFRLERNSQTVLACSADWRLSRPL